MQGVLDAMETENKQTKTRVEKFLYAELEMVLQEIKPTAAHRTKLFLKKKVD